MKTIVVSDTHLTAKFDKTKFNFLFNLFSSCDKLIVNGDFWSCYSSTFDEFVNSDWKELFPIMLRKNTTYIYGNHDREEFMDERINLFSNSACLRTKFTNGKTTFHIEHGHLFFKHQSIHNPKFMQINRELKIDERIRHPLDNFLYKKYWYKKISKIFGFMNNKIKLEGKKIIDEQIILVTGHTHIAEFNRNTFVNTGFIDQGLAWYLEITDRDYQLRSVSY